MKLYKTKFSFLFLLLFFGVSMVNAQNFQLKKGVFGNGGGEGTSANYTLNGTLGQTLTGTQTSASFEKEIGFWNQYSGIPTAVDDFVLYANLKSNNKFEAFPNPFSTAIKLQLNLNDREWVSINIYDASGNKIRTVIEDVLPKQQHIFTFYADGLPNGMYYCKVLTNDFSVTEKISLIQ